MTETEIPVETPEETPRAKEYDALVTTFIQRFGVLRQSYRLFTAENDTTRDNLARFREALDQCFEIANPLALVIVRERLYIGDLQIKSRHPLVADLVDVLLERMIRRVAFHKNVTNKEIAAIAHVLNLSPIELRDRGGPTVVLREDHAVENISVGELTGFAPTQTGEADAQSWQKAVRMTGMDLDEVVAYMKGPQPVRYRLVEDRSADLEMGHKNLLRSEKTQLVELLLNPRVLARLLLELATVDTDEGPMVDPRELIRVVRRTEGSMIFGSQREPESIREKISEALMLIGDEVRVAVLSEILRLRAEGVHLTGADVFAFSPKEWARAIVEIDAEEDGEAILARVALTGAEWRDMQEHVEAFAGEHAADGGRRAISDYARLGRFMLGRKEDGAAPPDDRAWEALADRSHRKAVERALDGLQHNLQAHIERGYVNALLVMIRNESDNERLASLVRTFFEQLQRLATHRPADVVAFLERLWAALDAIEAPRPVAGEARRLWGDLYGNLISRLTNIENAEQRETIQRLLPLLTRLDVPAVAEIIERCYLDARMPNAPLMAEILEPVRQDAANALALRVDPAHRDFRPRHLAAALRLFVVLRGEACAPAILRLVASERPAIRMIALLELVRGELPQTAAPVFAGLVGKPGKDATVAERVLAAYGLGRMRAAGAAPLLKRVAKGPLIVGRAEPHELRLAALHAYACVTGDASSKSYIRLYRRVAGKGIYRLFK
ncbi:hypothetical protein K8I61_13005 [bacterium]|nr:hypothetical protein [bacterium]